MSSFSHSGWPNILYQNLRVEAVQPLCMSILVWDIQSDRKWKWKFMFFFSLPKVCEVLSFRSGASELCVNGWFVPDVSGQRGGSIYKCFRTPNTDVLRIQRANYLTVCTSWGTAVAQWLRCCATNRKVAGSIPDGVMEFFIDIILPIALWPWGRLSL